MSIPLLIKTGEGLNAEFFLSIDNYIIDVHGNITAGIHRLFQSIFVLHLEYSPQVLHFFRLFERIVKICTITPAPAIQRILDKVANTVVD